METSWAYCRLVIWGPDAINEMVGSAPGLTGAMKAVAESVVYTTGETVSWSMPSLPHTRFNWT